MGNTKAIELEGLMSKPFLKVIVKTRISTIHPELTKLITEKVIVKCLIYISGYIKCFTYHVVMPTNKEEIVSLLTQECIDWIINYITKGGK